MPEWFNQLVSGYGYLVVFLGVFLENMGIPIPGETVLLAAAFLAQTGALSLPMVIAVGVVAAILGDTTGYWIGRRGGRAFAEEHGGKIGLNPGRLSRLEAFFAKHGDGTVFLARFVTGVRVFAAIYAGIIAVPWRRFLVYNVAGALAWATAYSLLGWLFGMAWHGLSGLVSRPLLLAMSLGGAVLLLWIARRYGRRLVRAVTAREVFLTVAHLTMVGVFVTLAEEVRFGRATELDMRVILALHRIASPLLDQLALFFSFVGSDVVQVPLIALVASWAWRRGDRRAARSLIAVGLSALAFDWVLKHLFQRPRPSLWVGLVHITSYSFPSGHSLSAVAIFGMLGVVVTRLYRPCRYFVPPLVAVLALLIGTSRPYLGVHWPTDVLAGFTAGSFLLLAGVVSLGRPRVSPPPAAPAPAPDPSLHHRFDS